ncbi:hypothetical protein [Micromonospora deserti]|uniref:hypothetical protein n=1 Tax=Micromonospora deserti TaxID=2070366 RepID=UPI0018F6E096|nr:hypothetical protein [Micromonospora deserti]
MIPIPGARRVAAGGGLVGVGLPWTSTAAITAVQTTARATRKLQKLVRRRAKLVALRSGLKAQVHAVLAKCGVAVPMSDLFGVGAARKLITLVYYGLLNRHIRALARARREHVRTRPCTRG